jgi:hypothetical protein
MSVYSPRLRTALVLTGTGTAGAYHAGVLRALREAGVKIDIVCGCGIGVAGALFAALDGGPRLWDADGIWRGPGVARLYGWRPSLVAAAGALVSALAALAAPALLLLIASLLLLTSVVLGWTGLTTASVAVADGARGIESLFQPSALPALVPRLAALACLALLVILTGTTILSARAGRRRGRGGWWWRPIATPLTARAIDRRLRAELWRIVRGAAPLAEPAPRDLSRRYAEMVGENLGQPGFRELLLTVHDLDGRRDLVFALLALVYRKPFFSRGTSADARSHPDLIDLAATGRDHVLDALGGAVSLPGLTDPHPTAFAPESYWRGEVHRLHSRPDALGRLLNEAHAAAAEQLIIVSADAPVPGPHALSAARSDLRGRASSELAAAGVAAVRDALTAYADRFQATFVVRPSHNPLGPLDFGGGYDERSDRRVPLAELIDRGYEDAYRQFIEPIVGAEVAEV